MHYVDEGPREGPPLVLVHGNLTWAYLWRNFIPALTAAGFRAIVPDHLGFGRSDKPDDAALYRIPRHAERLEQLLESLDLQEATVVPQDWGGPIGLAWAARYPQRIRWLAILNTFAHRPAYLAPHPTWASRTSVLVFPREIPTGPHGPVNEFLGSVHDGLMKLRSKPIFIAWAMQDIAFTPSYLNDLWLKDFPNAKVLRIPDAGHYLQEDAHEVIVPALVDF